MTELSAAPGTSFTPGPWQWDAPEYALRPVNREGDISAILVLENGRSLVRRPYSRPIEALDAELAADRLLIAAAPDLYAVVAELIDSASYWSEYDVPLGIVDRMQAALTKANRGAP